MCGGLAISPAGLNTSLLKVPCTQGVSQLICGPLAARPALLHALGPPNTLEVSDRVQGCEMPLKLLILYFEKKKKPKHTLIKKKNTSEYFSGSKLLLGACFAQALLTVALGANTGG